MLWPQLPRRLLDQQDLAIVMFAHVCASVACVDGDRNQPPR
jgi:hypothetical protein